MMPAGGQELRSEWSLSSVPVMNMQSVRALFRLSGTDRKVVFTAARRLMTLRLRRRYPRLAPIDDRTGPLRSEIDRARAFRLAHLVRRTANSLPFATTCLDRAVVLVSLLDDESLQSALRIGVRPLTGESLDAHAWVEHGDADLLVHDDDRSYLRFDTSLTVERP